MKDLENYVKENSKFLSVQDGETVIMVYKGYEIVSDRFNPGKQTVSYLLQYPDSEKAIQWNKSSNKIAAQMKDITIGETISITRQGEGMGTKYRIIPVGKKLGKEDRVPF